MKSVVGAITAVIVSLIGIIFINSTYILESVLGALFMLVAWGTLVEFLVDYLDILILFFS